MSITYTEVEANLRKLSKKVRKKSFIFDFLKCFDKTAKSILKRLEESYDGSELTVNGQLYFKIVSQDVEQNFENLCKEKTFKKNKLRFFLATDFIDLYAFDTKTKDKIAIPLNEIHYEFEFFMPLAGFEKASVVSESKADAKAAEKMAKLFDMLCIDNDIDTQEEKHSMNVFLSRLLFCFFAEDTEIFEKNSFSGSIKSLTKKDGSNVDDYLNEFFKVLNTKNRKNISKTLSFLPYVNGGLFSEELKIPKFNLRSRKALIECGALNWAEINPDIFGSMIQAVVDDKYRGNMGMHYTSVTNIMKVIEPLFISELNQEFLDIMSSKLRDETKITNLRSLIIRMSNIAIVDMACGSGNFLIISYKELRLLEIAILREIRLLSGSDKQNILQMNSVQTSISLSQFYGVELDDFAHEIAILSLWLTEHQLNQEFQIEFGAKHASLPLKSYKTIIQGNALEINWEDFIPKKKEVFIVGNPPFAGSSMQTPSQKNDMALVCKGFKKYKNLDYVSCWFLLGAKYIKEKNASMALVSTNSISQGDSVGMLWSEILKDHKLEIGFAHTSFKWKNQAKDNAGVTCVIIGLRNKSKREKYLFENELKLHVKNINAYLLDCKDVIVSSSRTPLNKLPEMIFGNKPTDGGYLILNSEEKNEIVQNYPESKKLIKKYIGSDELLKGSVRWCLWLNNIDSILYKDIPPVLERIKKVKSFRLKSTAQSTVDWASKPHLFKQGGGYKEKNAIFVPAVSSENREYLPVDFFDKNTVSSNRNYVIYTDKKYIFSLLSTKHHLLWTKTVGGRLETRLSYGNTLCYNTFPVPNLSETDIKNLESFTLQIILEREKQPLALGDLYKKEQIPTNLKSIHTDLDNYMDKILQKASGRKKSFSNDHQRLESMFKLYLDSLKG